MVEQHEVIVVGAGLAGLVCARDLHRAGREVLVLERGSGVGGRIRTDHVDGMLLDRGFQLLNPGYPRAPLDLDLAALDLRTFEAGAVVAKGSSGVVLADPRRSPRDLLSTATTLLGTLGQRARLAAWIAEIGFGPAGRIKHRPDTAFIDELVRRGIDGELVDSVLRPFLSGTLADGELATSRRFAELVVRSFVKGTPGVPAAGMQAIPEQVAADLPEGTVRLDRAVTSVGPGTVTAGDERFSARAVVIAAGPVTAAELMGRDFGRTRGLTTLYYLAPASPAHRTMLHLDGDRRGPVVNTAVLTDAAPSYAPGRTGSRPRSWALTRVHPPSVTFGRSCPTSMGPTRARGSTCAPTPSRTRCPTCLRGRPCADRSGSATASMPAAISATRRRSRVPWCPVTGRPRPSGRTRDRCGRWWVSVDAGASTPSSAPDEEQTMTENTGGQAMSDANQVEGQRSAAMDDEDEAQGQQDALHANEDASGTAERVNEER